jgi:hypothetical protein
MRECENESLRSTSLRRSTEEVWVQVRVGWVGVRVRVCSRLELLTLQVLQEWLHVALSKQPVF